MYPFGVKIVFLYGFIVATVALSLGSVQVLAQTFYDTGGRIPDSHHSKDSFSPIWEQKPPATPNSKALQDIPNPKQRIDSELVTMEPPDAANVSNPEPAKATGVRIETVRYDAWAVTCRDIVGELKKRSCSTVLRVAQPNKQIVIVWEIGAEMDGTLATTMQVQTGVFVKKPVELKVGNRVVANFRYTTCTPQFCEATGAVDRALRGKLANANDVTVTIRDKDGKDLRYRFAVKGIDRAIVALTP